MERRKAFRNVLLVELLAFAFLVAFIMVEELVLSVGLIAAFAVVLLLGLRRRRLVETLGESLAVASRPARVTVLVLALTLPLFFLRSAYVLHVLTFSLIYSIAALGLNFQIGSAGMVNFAQGTFVGIGAYTTGLLAQRLGLPFWVGLPAALVSTAAFGLLLGYPSLKTKSFYLSLVSIAFCYIAFLMIHNG